MSDYPKKLKDFIEILSSVTDPAERIEYLVSYADKFKHVTEDIAVPPYPAENKIPFCESGAYVWVHPQKDGTLQFSFAVENPQGVSAKALSAILMNTISGEKAEEIANIPDDIVYKIFGQGLSMGKNMGLTGIIQYIKRQAQKIIRS